MVERLQEMNFKGATFVDLDGTLIEGNSMHTFMKRLPATLLKRHAAGASIASIWWIGLRLIRLVSHRDMKWHLTKIARRHLLAEDWENIAYAIIGSINPVVKDYIAAPAREDCEKYIATAAIEEYALPLSRLLGYSGAIASRFSDKKSDYEENRAIAKKDAILQTMEDHNLRMESFLTDHDDDLPTAAAFPGLTILVNPTRERQTLFHNIGVTRYLITK